MTHKEFFMKWHAWVLLVLCISQPTMASEKKEAEATVPAVEDRLTTGERFPSENEFLVKPPEEAPANQAQPQ